MFNAKENIVYMQIYKLGVAKLPDQQQQNFGPTCNVLLLTNHSCRTLWSPEYNSPTNWLLFSTTGSAYFLNQSCLYYVVAPSVLQADYHATEGVCKKVYKGSVMYTNLKSKVHIYKHKL